MNERWAAVGMSKDKQAIEWHTGTDRDLSAGTARNKMRHGDGQGIASGKAIQPDDNDLLAPNVQRAGTNVSDNAELSFDVLLQESWSSYLAAKETGTPAQRVSALKAVYDHLSHQQQQQQSASSRPFVDLSDDALLGEVKRLLTLLAPELGLASTWDD